MIIILASWWLKESWVDGVGGYMSVDCSQDSEGGREREGGNLLCRSALYSYGAKRLKRRGGMVGGEPQRQKRLATRDYKQLPEN